MKGFETARANSGKVLSSGERLDPETFRELSTFFREVTLAKSGMSSVNTLGSGNVYVASWLADISYSFETGVLFMKKGQAVQERLLISGTFPLQPQYVLSQSQALVTDIFAMRPGTSFSDRMLGKEKSLTTGTAYASLTPNKSGIPSSTPVIPPLCTKAEAEKMANIYLESVRQRMQGKLKIGIPYVNQLVYVGGIIRNGWLEASGLPTFMHSFVGDEKALSAYSI